MSDNPRLNWRQRLEIYVGASIGLYYPHTDFAIAINTQQCEVCQRSLGWEFHVKVADFLLPKTGPDLDQSYPSRHVNMLVKGSFYYLDSSSGPNNNWLRNLIFTLLVWWCVKLYAGYQSLVHLFRERKWISFEWAKKLVKKGKKRSRTIFFMRSEAWRG